MAKRSKTQETQSAPLLPQSILTAQNQATGQWNVLIGFGDDVEPDIETFDTMDDAFIRAAELTEQYFPENPQPEPAPVTEPAEPQTDEFPVVSEP